MRNTGPAHLDEIHFLFLPDEAARTAALLEDAAETRPDSQDYVPLFE